MSWSPVYKSDDSNYVYIVTGHLNGNIRIWKINCIESYTDINELIQPVLILTENIFKNRVTAVHWSYISQDESN